MTYNYIPFEIETGELHNCQIINGQLKVRDGWRNVFGGLSTVYGFTVESANTTEVWHYIVQRNTSLDGYIGVYEEDFNLLYTFDLGKVPGDDFPVYYSVQNRQLMITSPSFNFTVYGLVGGGLTRAVKTDSINPDTTALDVPTGIMSEFQDRNPIAQGSLLYFNDPGIDPKTYVAENIIPLPSTIYHMEQTTEGVLACFCANGIYLIPRDAVGQGQEVFGFINKIPGYEAVDYRCAATSNGITICLTRNGIAALENELKLIPVQAFHKKRYFTQYVLPDDFRYGRVHKTENGFLVAYEKNALLIDIKNNYISWIYDKNNVISIKAVLSTRDGRDLYLTKTGILYPFGTKDDIDGMIDGYVAADVKNADSRFSFMVRNIIPASDNPNLLQYSYIRGMPSGTSTVTVSGIETIIGDGYWSSSQAMFDRELRSTRQLTNVRSDYLAVEIGTQGSNRMIGDISIGVTDSGKNRPNV